jgi:hypothetical protein
VDAKRTSRPRRTRAAADGDVGEGCDVFLRTRGRRSRSASGDADGADSPVNHELAPSETRDDIKANKRTRQPSKFITRSSPSSRFGLRQLLRQISLGARVRVRTTTEINRVA